MRIEQEEEFFKPQRTCAQDPKGTRLRQETDAQAQRRHCTQAQKFGWLHQKAHALTQRSTCIRPRSGNACFEKHANTPREQTPLNMEVHAHTPRSTCAYIKEYMHLFIRKEHMHLYKEVHAFGQEVVMLALRNTRTRQGNRCPWIWKYMHIRQGAHVLI